MARSPTQNFENLAAALETPPLTDIARTLADSEYCGHHAEHAGTILKLPISPTTFSLAIGQLGGCNQSLDLGAMNPSMFYFSVWGSPCDVTLDHFSTMLFQNWQTQGPSSGQEQNGRFLSRRLARDSIQDEARLRSS